MSHLPSNPNSHHREALLAESDNVAVHQCSCGMMHLQIGAVCLTMQPGELLEIGAVLARALQERLLVREPSAVVNRMAAGSAAGENRMRISRWNVAVVAVGLAMVSSVAAEPKKYGTGVALTEATTITSILAAPEKFAGQTVRVEGTVTAVCAHEGCWMALSADGRPDGPTLRLKVDDGVIVFPVTAKGHKAAAEGVVERVGGTPDSHEAAAEHAKQAPAALAEVSRHWQIKATGALVY